ncbi:acyl-CoA thioesterase [Chlorobaculum sp. MV4-Y]|uniref:acyl-CoA thioesterase n=1 Tax=Chlorobaculum sp. MV4-Y TaxID=2976335 RepID=UPI0021B06DE2|nr:thioesterase family protein [Chlorobaculum sp. MV4-Y]UWX58364.1 acyl-CoA thioesterase [Chlorobaculum sp. MV4-Y]
MFTHTFEVPGSSIDGYGHVSNIEYLRWMQDVATAHTASEGWTLDRYRKSRAIWVVRRHSIDYLMPAYAGDRLDLHTWIEWVRDCQSVRRYLLTREGESRAFARAETLWVCVDPESGPPKRVLEDFIQAFELVVGGEAEALRIVGKTPESAS